ncbi:MAG: helix-turn-helix transcriptional regulator [Peptococcaceae bacterium]|nr:helix-turn-helix transcriptional regulator [Peptococcaceae bacterium]
MNYGQRIKFFREVSGISANALAKKVGLDPTTIYKIEANDSKPSLGSLKNICEALGISLAEFFAEQNQSDLFCLVGRITTRRPQDSTPL